LRFGQSRQTALGERATPCLYHLVRTQVHAGSGHEQFTSAAGFAAPDSSLSDFAANLDLCTENTNWHRRSDLPVCLRVKRAVQYAKEDRR
jgi:hypothetical protein